MSRHRVQKVSICDDGMKKINEIHLIRSNLIFLLILTDYDDDLAQSYDENYGISPGTSRHLSPVHNLFFYFFNLNCRKS